MTTSNEHSESSVTKSAKALLQQPYLRTIVPQEDGTFHAEIVEFPGCMATGETAAEALLSLENTAESWLESVLEAGQPVPQPLASCDFSGKLMLRMPRSLHQKAATLAEHDNVSLNQFIVACLAERVGAASAPVKRETGYTVSPGHMLAGVVGGRSSIWDVPTIPQLGGHFGNFHLLVPGGAAPKMAVVEISGAHPSPLPKKWGTNNLEFLTATSSGVRQTRKDKVN